MKVGGIGGCTTTRVYGWAIEEGQPAELNVLVNGEKSASVRCNRPRPDLAALGLPTDAGFSFGFPQELTEVDEVAIQFLDGAPLRNSPLKPVRYEGHVGHCTASRVCGWALQCGQPAELEIYINHQSIARIRCSQPRPDLAAIGLATYAGFSFFFSKPLAASDEVCVRFLDGTPLSNSPRNPTSHEGRLELCTAWRVAGWAALGGKPAELDVFIGNQRMGRIICNIPRPDVSGSASNTGFGFLFPRPVLESEEVSIRFSDGTLLHNSRRQPGLDYAEAHLVSDGDVVDKPAEKLRRQLAEPERVVLVGNGIRSARLVNRPVIEAVAQARGFVLVDLDELNFTEQLTLVSNSRFLVILEGLPLFLAPFAAPGAKLCLLVHPTTAESPLLMALLSEIQVEAKVLSGAPVRADLGQSLEYQISPAPFAELLARWLKG